METVVRVRKLTPDLQRDMGVPPVVIAGPDAGIHGVHLATEMSGLVDPASEAVTKSPGGRPGTRLVSTRFTERNVVFRVTILGDGEEWFNNERHWRGLWSYDSYTEIEVERLGHSMVLRARLEEYDLDTDYDPAISGAVDVTMSVVADDPFWYDPGDLYGGGYRIDEGKSLTIDGIVWPHAAIYPRFEFRATGVNGSSKGWIQIELPDTRESYILRTPTLDKRNSYTLNTDPGSRQWMSEDDPNVWNRMNGVRYHIPDTTKAERIKITNGLGIDATVFLPVPYLRPW